MRLATALIALVLFSAPLSADDHIVDFDIRFDFSKVRTFAIRAGKVNSARAELNNSLVIQNLTATIRTALTARGLKETTARPDVFVDFSVDGQDYSVGPFGRASRIEGGGERGGRGRRGTVDPESSDPPGFSEAALVVDLLASQPELLIWRGVYRDNERNASKLTQKLPDDAKKLIAEYPPKGKR
jgi:Domain of unknown function (DUF4136)